MRAALLSTVILTLGILAGCLGDDEGTIPAPEPTPPPTPFSTFLAAGANLTGPGRPAPVNFVATNSAGPANELSFAVNPTDPLNLIGGGKDYHLGTDHPCVTQPSGTQGYPINVWSGVYWSRDGGQTWKNALMPGHPADDANATHPNRAWSCVSDPVVVFDDTGLAYFSGLGIWGDNVPNPTHPCVQTGRSIWVMKSLDGGETWQDFECVAGSTYDPNAGGQLLDKQWFDVDGRNVYFTYVNFNPTGDFDLTFRRSRDQGQNWDPEIILLEGPTPSSPDAPLGGRQFATPQVGPDGTIYVTWHGFGTDNGVYFTKSIDSGTTFEVPRRIFGVNDIPGQFFDGGYRTGTYPVLAVDDSSGPQSASLYVIWADGASDDADVLVARSTDNGATWNDPIMVNNVTKGVQFMPWVATGPDGTLAVLWLDSAAYENETRLDAVLRVSLDGGVTWQPQLRVNATPIETETCHHQNGSNFIGDYLAVTLSQDAIYAFWPDGAPGRCEAMAATILR